MVVTKLLEEGFTIGGGVSLALVVADLVIDPHISPAQRRSRDIGLVWVAQIGWVLRRSERCAGELVVVHAIVATMAALTVRTVEWVRRRIDVVGDRREVHRLEATRSAHARTNLRSYGETG